MENRHGADDLRKMQLLPLEAKIQMTRERIKAWYDAWWRWEIEDTKTGKIRYVTSTEEPTEHNGGLKKDEILTTFGQMDGAVYLAFSGGKDSTVLKHIIDQMTKEYIIGEVPAVFVNTGLEYPEIQRFVRDVKAGKYDCFCTNVETVRPEMQFADVLSVYGYPVVSKEVSNVVREAKISLHRTDVKYNYRLQRINGTLTDKCGNPSQYNCEKWKFLMSAPFDVSEECCKVMKKKPSREYGKRSGRMPIIATMASESRLRKQKWIQHGCNAFGGKNPTSQPLSFWTEQDVLHYIKKYKVPYASIYDDIVEDTGADFDQVTICDYAGHYAETDRLKTTGAKRTGCIFCMFGCHLEKQPNRFQMLKETHPRQYEYCIGGGEMVDGKWKPNKDGLGLGKVLDYIGVEY